MPLDSFRFRVSSSKVVEIASMFTQGVPDLSYALDNLNTLTCNRLCVSPQTKSLFPDATASLLKL